MYVYFYMYLVYNCLAIIIQSLSILFMQGFMQHYLNPYTFNSDYYLLINLLLFYLLLHSYGCWAIFNRYGRRMIQFFAVLLLTYPLMLLLFTWLPRTYMIHIALWLCGCVMIVAFLHHHHQWSASHITMNVNNTTQ